MGTTITAGTGPVSTVVPVDEVVRHADRIFTKLGLRGRVYAVVLGDELSVVRAGDTFIRANRGRGVDDASRAAWPAFMR